MKKIIFIIAFVIYLLGSCEDAFSQCTEPHLIQRVQGTGSEGLRDMVYVSEKEIYLSGFYGDTLTIGNTTMLPSDQNNLTLESFIGRWDPSVPEVKWVKPVHGCIYSKIYSVGKENLWVKVMTEHCGNGRYWNGKNIDSNATMTLAVTDKNAQIKKVSNIKGTALSDVNPFSDSLYLLSFWNYDSVAYEEGAKLWSAPANSVTFAFANSGFKMGKKGYVFGSEKTRIVGEWKENNEWHVLLYLQGDTISTTFKDLSLPSNGGWVHIKVSRSGNLQVVKSFSFPYFRYYYFLHTNGYFYFTGRFRDSVLINDTVLIKPQKAGYYGNYLIKFTRDFQLKWARYFYSEEGIINHRISQNTYQNYFSIYGNYYKDAHFFDSVTLKANNNNQNYFIMILDKISATIKNYIHQPSENLSIVWSYISYFNNEGDLYFGGFFNFGGIFGNDTLSTKKLDEGFLYKYCHITTSYPDVRQKNNKSLLVFPVPVKETLHIQLPNTQNRHSEFNYQIININGIQAGQGELILKEKAKVPLNYLPAGVYIIRLYNENEFYFDKFIKK